MPDIGIVTLLVLSFGVYIVLSSGYILWLHSELKFWREKAEQRQWELTRRDAGLVNAPTTYIVPSFTVSGEVPMSSKNMDPPTIIMGKTVI